MQRPQWFEVHGDEGKDWGRGKGGGRGSEDLMEVIGNGMPLIDRAERGENGGETRQARNDVAKGGVDGRLANFG